MKGQPKSWSEWGGGDTYTVSASPFFCFCFFLAQRLPNRLQSGSTSAASIHTSAVSTHQSPLYPPSVVRFYVHELLMASSLPLLSPPSIRVVSTLREFETSLRTAGGEVRCGQEGQSDIYDCGRPSPGRLKGGIGTERLDWSPLPIVLLLQAQDPSRLSSLKVSEATSRDTFTENPKCKTPFSGRLHNYMRYVDGGWGRKCVFTC